MKAWLPMFRLDNTIDIAIVAIVSLALLIASIRVWHRARRHRAALLLLQWPCAALLLAALLVRDVDVVDTLIVSTPGAAADAAGVPSPAAVHVALPGFDIASDSNAVAGTSVRRVPDLATALRQHPAVRRVVVLGDGLAEHDLAAVGQRDLVFDTPDAPRQPALAALHVPSDITTGALWQLSGRIVGQGVTHIELSDPSGTAAARAVPDGDGRFALQALARAAGPASFALRLFSDDREVQHVEVHIDARSPPPLRALLLAAAPSPELKYLRRWALDAGVDLASRIDAAPGLGTRRGEHRLDAATLDAVDLLVLDERSWPQSDAQRTLLRDAIAGGLGVLVRITGPVPARVVDDLRGYGLDATSTGNAPVDVSIDPRFVSVPGAGEVRVDTAALRDARAVNPPSDQAAPTTPAAAVANGSIATTLHAWPLTAAPHAASSLLHDADLGPIAARVDTGRGRIALWPLTDTWRLVTRGAPESHASLWAHVWSSLARARTTPLPGVPTLAVLDRRVSLCAEAALRVVAPDGSTTALLHDPATGCAAFWPRQVGWHRVESEPAEAQRADSAISNRSEAQRADSATSDRSEDVDGSDRQSSRMFHVAAPDAYASIEREQRTHASAARASETTGPHAPNAGVATDALRALLLAAWLMCLALVWWLERRAGSGQGIDTSPVSNAP